MPELPRRPRPGWKRRLLTFAGLLLLLSLLGNPATMHLGLTLDAVGIDTFMILLEIQLVAVAALGWQRWGMPVLSFAGRTLRPLAAWPPAAALRGWLTDFLFWRSGLLGLSLALGVDRLKARMGLNASAEACGR